LAGNLLVALSVENFDALHIESLQELPDEAKLKIPNCKSLRAQHAMGLRCLMRDVLQECIQSSRYIIKWSEGITTQSDLENVLLISVAIDTMLESALADMRAG